MPGIAQALTHTPNALRIEDHKNGTLVIGADQVVLEEHDAYRTVLVVWGNVEVYGVAEELVLLSGKIRFHPGSRVTKSLVVVGGEFNVQAGADVADSRVVFQTPGPLWSLLRSAGNLWREYYEGAIRWITAVSLCLVTWLLGLIVFAAFPGLQKATEGRFGKEWGKNLVAGILGATLAPILFALLILSVIGIVALPFYVLFLLAAGFLAYAAAGLWAGHRILPPKKETRINPLGFLLGLAALQFLWAVNWVWATIPAFLLWLIGWGSVVRSLRAIWK